MIEEFKSYSTAGKQVGSVMKYCYQDISEIKLIKNIIQDSYNTFAKLHHPRICLNLGLWDKKVYKEYMDLHYDFSAVSEVQDIHSQLLIYYLIRPLVKMQFFNKRLLEVGCGNGLGLKASSELLHADYALGVDLVHRLATNAHNNHYKQDKVNYIQSDAESLPLDNESIDIVTNLESSHLYPRIEYFFSEVERVLTPGGYFCYSDHYISSRDQSGKLEQFIKKSNSLKIVQKTNITKLVQASLYDRLIVNEDSFYQLALYIIGEDENTLYKELPTLAAIFGLVFLPWWKIKFKNSALHRTAKLARRNTFWGKKYYFYYLIQKV